MLGAFDHSWLEVNKWQAYPVPLIPTDEPQSQERQEAVGDLRKDTLGGLQQNHGTSTQPQLKDCGCGFLPCWKTRANLPTFAFGHKERL